MFCGNCGKQIQDNATVCPYCGAPTGVAEEVHAQPQYGAQTPSYNQQNYGGQSQPYNQQNYGGQSHSYNQQYNSRPAQQYEQRSSRSSAYPYDQNRYGAQNYNAGNAAGGVPENGFDAVNKVVLAKLGYVDNRPVTHAYQRLGGFLAVATYRWGIMAIILVYNMIQILTSISKVSSALSAVTSGGFGGYGDVTGAMTGAVTVLVFLIILSMGSVIAFNILMFIFLEKKNTVFLKFFEIVAIVVFSIVVIISIAILCGVGNMDMGFAGDYVMSLLTGFLFPIIFWTGAIFALWILYFGKSVRVRTYFGTDEYLRRSIFCKKWVYPIPLVPDRPMM